MASPLKTELCDQLGIEYPIMLAGMGGAAGPTLAAAVSEAGGLGVVGATGYTPEELIDMINKVRSLTDKPFGVDLLLPSSIADTGNREDLEVEITEEHRRFVDQLKEEFSIPEPTTHPNRPPLTKDYFKDQVGIILDQKVPVFAAGLGNPGWMIPDAHAQGMKVIGLVGNVKNAKRVAAVDADAVVAQGTEAGGHTGRIGTLALVPQVVDAVAPTKVVAAGGIGDGRGIVAAMALGAEAVWCGTAFLATPEAYLDAQERGETDQWTRDLQHRKLVSAVDEDTRIGRMYSGKTMRHVYNAWSEAWERPEAPPTLPMPLQGMLVGEALRGAREAQIEELVGGPAGNISGLITEVRGAKAVMQSMIAEAEALLDRMGAKA
ncbi:MAG TPA: nitronate monooxygenase [Dehalococcoidia bacterium]|nr:nitronate monooxygenase [Dehalococcoidia bacterium]